MDEIKSCPICGKKEFQYHEELIEHIEKEHNNKIQQMFEETITRTKIRELEDLDNEVSDHLTGGDQKIMEQFRRTIIQSKLEKIEEAVENPIRWGAEYIAMMTRELPKERKTKSN